MKRIITVVAALTLFFGLQFALAEEQVPYNWDAVDRFERTAPEQVCDNGDVVARVPGETADEQVPYNWDAIDGFQESVPARVSGNNGRDCPA